MHTDEYEISLWRELKICEGYVREARVVLDRMEARHGMSTAAFLAHGAGPTTAMDSDRNAWQRAHESLLRWSRTRDEYRILLDTMRQSAPR